MSRVVAVPAGSAVVDAVLDAVDDLQSHWRQHQVRAGAPSRPPVAFVPVTVLCGGAVESRALRRAALDRVRGGARSGMAGVEFTTIGRMSRALAQPAMAERGVHPAGPVELLAAIRAELYDQPGLFGSVAAHRTTHDRLVALYQELTGLDTETVIGLQAEAEGLSAEALRVVLGAGRRLDRAVDERRIMTMAMAELQARSKGRGLPLVVVNPDPTRAFERRMVAALVQQPDTVTVVAVTGHGSFDRAYRKRAAQWGVNVGVGLGTWPVPSSSEAGTGSRLLEPTAPEPGRASLVETAAPDEEVRAAVRQIVARATVGTPLSSMALLYTAAEPYARIVHDQLGASGLPFHGPGHRALGGCLAGRTLRRLLGLAAHGLERGAVVSFLNAAPIDTGHGREAPALLWDRLSRQAGVIEGDHWRARLAELAEGATFDQPRSSFDPPDTVTVESSRALISFMVELQGRLRPPATATWAAWAGWAAELLDRYLLVDPEPGVQGAGVDGAGNDTGSPGFPTDELSAVDEVKHALDRVGALDCFGVPPDLESFEASVESELDGVIMPGPKGGGLYVGPLTSAALVPFERVVVVGMVEGLFPRVPREDSLLPDELRRRVAHLLPDRSVITDTDGHGAALVASGSGPTATFLTSRGDLRSSRSRAWPHNLRTLIEGPVQVIASHHEGLADHGHPASLADFELRALINHVDAGEPIDGHGLAVSDPVLAAGLAQRRHRDRDRLGPYTGGVGPMVDPGDHLFSPTALETYAQCPRKYLLQRILRLGEDERPERIAHITGLQRGKLVHRLLYRFLDDAIVAKEVPEPDEPWPPARRAHLFDLLEEEVKAAHGRGITGGQVQTEILRQQLMGEMQAFLDLDDQVRRTYRSRPVHAEHEFGLAENPLVLSLRSGRSVPLRGAVDRVDVTDDGGLLVIDYKGGSDRSFAGLDDDPLDSGRRLQLPLYARVLAEDRGLTGPRIGLYWLTASGKILTVALDDDLESDMEDVVGVALDGIGNGVFPAVPGQAVSWPRLTFENCRYCDFDRICPTDRHREWERIRLDPSVATIDTLRRPVEIDAVRPDRRRSPDPGRP